MTEKIRERANPELPKLLVDSSGFGTVSKYLVPRDDVVRLRVDPKPVQAKMSGYFDALRKNIGKEVMLDRGMGPERVVLKDVEETKEEGPTQLRISETKYGPTSSQIVPFIGHGCAIWRVTTPKGDVLYDNPFLDPIGYGLLNPDYQIFLLALIRGDDVAKARAREIDELFTSADTFEEKIIERAKACLPESFKLVMPSMLEQWKTFTAPLVGDTGEVRAVLGGVVEAAVGTIKALSEGKSQEQTLEVLNGFGLNGAMENTAVLTIARYYEKGAEFAAFYNKKYSGILDVVRKDQEQRSNQE